MTRQLARVMASPGNPWAWYELCKAQDLCDEAALAGYCGTSPLPDAALEGLAEYLSRPVTTSLKGAN